MHREVLRCGNSEIVSGVIALQSSYVCNTHATGEAKIPIGLTGYFHAFTVKCVGIVGLIAAQQSLCIYTGTGRYS